MLQSESESTLVVQQNNCGVMSRLTVWLVVVLIIGSSLAEVVPNEQSAKEGTVDGSGSGTDQAEDKQLGDLAAEDKAVKDEELKPKEVKVDEPRVEDEPVEDKELPDEAMGDGALEEDVTEDAGEDAPKPVATCKKSHSTRSKHRRMEDTKQKLHGNTKTTFNEDEEDSTEIDYSTEDDAVEDDDEEVLTRATCKNGLSLPQLRSRCCQSLMLLDEDLDECIKLEKPNTFTGRHDKKTFRVLVRMVDCFYRRKMYIKSGRRDRLNMKRIKADAKKLNDPEWEEFMVEMYRTCGSSAKEAVKIFKRNPRKVNRDFHSAHEVFQFVLYACVDGYPQQNTCPHFLWFGLSASSEAKCTAYAEKCKQLVGH